MWLKKYQILVKFSFVSEKTHLMILNVEFLALIAHFGNIDVHLVKI